MPCLVYCVTQLGPTPAADLVGVADQPVLTHESQDLRIYWSEVANAETLSEGPARKAAEVKLRQVLREVIAVSTALSFPYPSMVAGCDAMDTLLSEQRDFYREALTRLADTVQYELTATWAEEERADFATPVSGREYVKRRQQAETRIGAIDSKLKNITAGIVREWRSRQDRRRRIWFALLARADRERFLAALRSAGPSEGVRLRLSGPWPPNEFVLLQRRPE